MKAWTKDGRVAHVLERALGRTAWFENIWEDAPFAHAVALQEALRKHAERLPVAKAVAAAFASADASRGLAAPSPVRVAVLTFAIREISTEAAQSFLYGEEVVVELRRVAAELAKSLPEMAPADGGDALAKAALAGVRKAIVPNKSSPDPAAQAFESVAEAGLKRLSEEALAAPTAAEGRAHALLTDADERLQKSASARWKEAPAWMRRALVGRAVSDSARELALAAALVHGAGAEAVAARVALTQAAAALARTSVTIDGFIDNQGGVSRYVREARALRAEEQKKKMADEKSPLVQTLQNDANEAAWRTAGSQLLKLSREPLVALLQRHLGPEDNALRAKLATFLETPVGTAVLASLLSVGLSALPNMMGDKPARLSRELRVRAMADAADIVADVLMGPLRTVITTYLSDAAAGGPVDATIPAIGVGSPVIPQPTAAEAAPVPAATDKAAT